MKMLDLAELSTTHPALIIDAIFGTGLTQAPRPPFSEIARIVNSLQSPVLAIDIPSGLDCDTGRPIGAAIRDPNHYLRRRKNRLRPTLRAANTSVGSPSATYRAVRANRLNILPVTPAASHRHN